MDDSNKIENQNSELIEPLNQEPKIEDLLQSSPKLKDALLQITHQQHFSGPMPPPEVLAKYEELVPGIAKQLFDGVAEDAKHIREMQKSALNAQKRDNLLGQIFGFLIGTIAILSGTYAAVNGAMWPGGLIGSGGVVALVAVFVLGRNANASK